MQGIIAARLDVLPPAEKELLHRAAVVGKVFWSGRGRARSETIARVDVELTLHGLERRELVRGERRSSVGGETEYAFRHALLRDVAYGQIPRAAPGGAAPARRALDRGLGRAEDMAELRAHHWLNAVDYARQAGLDADELRAHAGADRGGGSARALNALEAADRFYGQALALWPDEGLDRDLLAIGAVAVGVLQSTPIDRDEIAPSRSVWKPRAARPKRRSRRSR